MCGLANSVLISEGGKRVATLFATVPHSFHFSKVFFFLLFILLLGLLLYIVVRPSEGKGPLLCQYSFRHSSQGELQLL